VVGLLVVTGLSPTVTSRSGGRPLHALVGKESSERVAGIHRLIEPLTILPVLAHLGAILYCARVKKEAFIMPMITGWKVGAGETARGCGAVACCVAAYSIPVAKTCFTRSRLLPSAASVRRRSILGCLPGFWRASSVCSA
jgi:hypothetical protein